ncbi:helix-turn-helix domain-containing protein [Azotobacter salinestris]|uniref:helix-turn-helix domain-containing protein n=1 Tax=Azotobacter salinestris TaxID=69964 RepID=UPI0032DFD445
MRKKSATAVLARLKVLTGCTTDTALASALGISPQTLSSWKSRDTIPYALCVEVADARGVSLDWLLVGEGPMTRGEGEAPAAARESAADYDISPGERALLELFRSLDEDDCQELQHVASQKRRLTLIEQRLEELAAVVATLKRPI